MLALILASALSSAAEEPPSDLARRVAERESAAEAERSHYTYRQKVSISDYAGEYRETRDVIFSPAGERSEIFVGKPSDNLKRLRLTEEDFRDIREIQPMLLARDTLWIYETKYRGEEEMDGVECWALQIRPRQILQGQRLFDGMLWIDQRDYSVVRTEGKAVPEVITKNQENLFPRFTTLRDKIAGDFRFPVKTYGDDTLQFRSGPVRVRMIIEYSNYKRFGSESKIEYK